MKVLKDRQEIAMALNFGKYPVLSIDIADCDEYGLKGSICKIDFGKFDSGEPWLERAEIRVYEDEKKLTFSSGGACLHSDYSYHDFDEDRRYAQAPIVKPNSEIAVAVFDSEKKEAYGVFIVETGGIHRFCSTPLSCIDADMSGYIYMAGARYHRF